MHVGRGLNFICVTGISASGKDYQSERLVADVPTAVRLSPGDLMRKAQKSENKNHGFLKPYIDLLKVGGIFPGEVTMSILAAEISDHVERGADTFVLTGFPRNEGNLNTYDKYLLGIRKWFWPIYEDMVFLSIDEAEAFKRRDLRVSETLRRNEEVRADDLPGVMEKKLVVFKEETQPLINRLVDSGRMLVVDARGSKDETQRELRRNLMWDSYHPPVEGAVPPRSRR